ncbi:MULTISPECIES: methionine gamma-lyase [Porphyromonas]|uniref:L-methionine gamma-lyase n=1 Tax=Porphyromonas canoris TaxID=36875 RepID=A0ABR4XK32_9PORP|nr:MULTISPECIES: methionine gamma-lyase [Porphyromonas]KGN70520.1 methionine gamma-lyase [Porphyromonas sp. COT-108 OH1349]KGN92038.1 methionine gamma-lyase [Porphyromonas canoris]KGN96107.1 methionine gamma-lyase [Porphyromonas sp. COT-108 OH2963]
MNHEKIEKAGFATKAIHGGSEKNAYGALATPIFQTSTFVFDSAEQGGARFALEEPGYIYSRLGNPSCTKVEKKLALLEGAEAAMSTASGIGAVTSAIWILVQTGDHIVAHRTLYGCTHAYFTHGLSRYGIEVTYVDMRDPQEVAKAMRPNTKVVYLESPANPNMDMIDIAAVAEIAHRQEGVQVMVDNTYCTPYICRPLEHGADIIIHSATKYLNGHGDVIAGFVVGKEEYINQVRLLGVKDLTGASLSPFDAFLIDRGMKTLPIRVEKHSANAQKVAEFLEKHPQVSSISYPGLESFPQRDLVKKYMSLPGGMISFELKGGMDAGKKLINAMQMCKVAVSLGDAETLIQHPASMTHSPYTPEERAMANISDGLVRLSVGLEDAEDIIADLKQGLDAL